MHTFRAAVAIAATLSLAVIAGATSAGATSAGPATAVTPRAAQRLGATLKASGHARTGTSVKVAVKLTLPRGDKLAGYTLDFGDHTKPAKGSKLPGSASHTYLRPGKYVVTLVATDRHRVSWKASLTETVTGKTVHASGTTTNPGISPSGLPRPPAGCNGTSSPGVNVYNTTPAGDGPWTVPSDPCNSEGIGDSNTDIYADAGYWAAEKRPDIWTSAVLKYGYADDPYGPWNVEVDAARSGYPIDGTPRAGDLAVWSDDAVMGIDSTGTEQDASPGGQAAYVEAVNPDGTIVISEMGAGAEDGGYTYTLTYDPGTYFIHQN